MFRGQHIELSAWKLWTFLSHCSHLSKVIFCDNSIKVQFNINAKKACLLLLGILKYSTNKSQTYRGACTAITSTAHNYCLGRRVLNRGHVLECYCKQKPNIYSGHLQESFWGGSDPSQPLQANIVRFFDSLILKSLGGQYFLAPALWDLALGF